MKSLLWTLVLALSTVTLAAPAVSAAHSCEERTALFDNDRVAAGVLSGGCAGVLVVTPGPCHTALWGYDGDAFGVGGRDGCETTAYVGTRGVEPLLP